MDEAVTGLKEKHEREKNLLTEENRKLTAENDKVTSTVGDRPVRALIYPEDCSP